MSDSPIDAITRRISMLARQPANAALLLPVFTVFFLSVLVLNPQCVFSPFLYAEDGPWLANLIATGFARATACRADYWVFGNIASLQLAHWFCTWLPAGYYFDALPLTVWFFATAIACGCYLALFVALSRFIPAWLAGAGVWVMVLFPQTPYGSLEIWGRPSNLGFFSLLLGLAANLVLADPRSTAERVFWEACFIISVLTSPLAVFSAVARLASADPGRHFATVRASAAFAGPPLPAFCYLLGVFAAPSYRPQQSLGQLDPSAFSIALFARSIAYPFVTPVYRWLSLASAVVISVVFLLCVCGAWWTCRVRSPSARTAARMLLAVTGVGLAASVLTLLARPELVGWAGNIPERFPDRYFFMQNSLLLLAGLLSLGLLALHGRHRTVVVGAAAAGLLLAAQAILMKFAFLVADETPRAVWPDEVRRATAAAFAASDPQNPITVYAFPENFRFDLPAVTIVSLATKSRRPELLISCQGRVIVQPPRGRGREEGLFYVDQGKRYWVTDPVWLTENGVDPARILQVSSEDFSAIPDGGQVRSTGRAATGTEGQGPP